MRVSASTLLLASALLVAFSSAEQVLGGRNLHQEKGESRSKYYTDVFSQGDSYNGGHEKFEGGYLAGVVCGFIVTGVFMIFAVINLVVDEYQRHGAFQKKVDNDIKSLKLKGIDDATLEKWAREFADKELNRGKPKDTEEERQRLAEIN